MGAGVASAFERSPAEIQEQRQETIDRILGRNDPADVAIDRNNCMAGRMPSMTRIARKNDGGISPNAADLCVAALIRTGKESALLAPYKRIVTDGNGDLSVVDRLPATIGGAVVEQQADSVSIGNGLAMTIDPAIAFDAGFSAAYLKGEKSAPGMPDLPTLKAVSESCLDQTQARLGLCFAAGYAHGVRANVGEAVMAD